MVLFRRSKGRSTPADAIESSSRASSSSESLPEGNESKKELKSEVVALKKATKRVGCEACCLSSSLLNAYSLSMLKVDFSSRLESFVS